MQRPIAHAKRAVSREVLVALPIALLLALTAVANVSAGLDRSLAGRGFLFTPTNRVPVGPLSARVAEDANGRLVAVTGAGDEFMATRYLRNGRLDPGFGEGGIARVPLSTDAGARRSDEALASAIAIQPDGRILIGGSYDPDLVIEGGSGASELALVRLRPDGSIDSAFGGSAVLGVPAGRVIERRGANIMGIALQGKKILVGGEAAAGPAYVARYMADGMLDRSFGRGTGMARFTRRRAHGAITGLQSPSHGRIYAAGYLGADFLLARLNRNGIPDPRFGRGGRVLTNAAKREGCGCSVGQGLAVDRRGRVLVSGTLLAGRPAGHLDPESIAGTRGIAVARYRPGGSLDRSFGRDGVVRTGIGARSAGRGMAILRDGGILVAGSSAKRARGKSRFTVVAYRPNGRRDRRLFGDGTFARSLGGLASEAWDPIVDRSERIVVAGGGAAGKGALRTNRGIVLARFLPGR